MNEIINKILLEVHYAKTKHPDWPSDIVYASAIVSEESGELIRAALNHKFEGGSIEDVKSEAIQTAATCIRLLTNL